VMSQSAATIGRGIVPLDAKHLGFKTCYRLVT
jgi:hypothetical protein